MMAFDPFLLDQIGKDRLGIEGHVVTLPRRQLPDRAGSKTDFHNDVIHTLH